MAKSIKLLVYPVSDVEKAKTFYNAFLGADPYADTPYYVGYRTEDLEIGLDPHSKDGPIAYKDVDDIQASLEEMTNAGAEIVQDITDVSNGLLIAQIKDTNGNVVGLRQEP
jgi:predicted enzyme related to lactoylglutathione lyase